MLIARITRGLATTVGSMALIAIIVIMMIPVVVIVVMSFAADRIVIFPPRHWGLDHYTSFVESDYWVAALRQSFEISLPSAALALVIGVPAVFAMRNTRNFPLPGLFQAIGASPLVIPSVAYALAVYVFYLDVHLTGTIIGVILIDSALALPFVLLIVGSVYDRIPRELELVAMSLGASPTRAVVGITLRLMLPGIGAAFIFGFIAAFDDAVFINFVGGPTLETLPKAIYDSLQTSMAPLINAVATILMVGTGVILSLASYWRYTLSKRSSEASDKLRVPANG